LTEALREGTTANRIQAKQVTTEDYSIEQLSSGVNFRDVAINVVGYTTVFIAISSHRSIQKRINISQDVDIIF
jgi:hypothetical protein